MPKRRNKYRHVQEDCVNCSADFKITGLRRIENITVYLPPSIIASGAWRVDAVARKTVSTRYKTRVPGKYPGDTRRKLLTMYKNNPTVQITVLPYD